MMMAAHARLSVATSFVIISFVGAGFVFSHWSSQNIELAIWCTALFVVIMACIHATGYILYVEQNRPKPVAVLPQPGLHGISPLYWSAFREAAFAQSLLGIPLALLLDGGRAFSFFGVAILSQWISTLMIVTRRPTSPTKGDLYFIRIGILPLCVLTGGIAPFVWKVLGESDLHGLHRLFGG